MKLTVIAAVGLVTGSTYANAGGFETGNDLFDYCQRREASCTAYVLGAVDGFTYSDELHGQSEANHLTVFCTPDHANGAQLTDVFAKYLRDHPEKRHFAAASLILGAMMDAFPCPNVSR